MGYIIIVYGILYASLKVNKEDKDEYLKFLFSAGFDHMMEEEWDISYFIFALLIKEECNLFPVRVTFLCGSGLEVSQIGKWIKRDMVCCLLSNGVSRLHSTRDPQTMSLFVFAKLILPYPHAGLRFSFSSRKK